MLLALLLVGFVLSPSLADETAAPATSVPGTVSIRGNLWSGDVHDLTVSGGRTLMDLHGAMQIDFASARFTMGGSELGGWERRGAIRDFNQSSPDQVTFTLYIEANCAYEASARIVDGHLKGSYTGCSIATRNGGTFDLVPVPSPTPIPTPAPIATSLPTLQPTSASTLTPAERRAAAGTAALFATMRSAEARYCKTAAQIACSFYQMHAGQCLSTALGANAVYQGVVALRKAGLTSAQVQEQEDQVYGSASDNSFIAAAALKVLDEHAHYDPGAFEMAIMRVCLAGIAK
jgi:hypothetical protein